jgi:hypothetical protein
MPGEHDSADVIGADGRIKVGAAVVVVKHQLRTDSMVIEQVADKIDELQVRCLAGGIEGD